MIRSHAAGSPIRHHASRIRNLGIAGVLAAGILPAVHAQPVVRWRIASSFPRSLDTQGAKLRPFPPDVMRAAFKVSKELYAELSSSYPAWAKGYADYAKFRGEQNLRFRFTEATFDRFMRGQKL
jgi:TRAP-type mannitol/chloroaromatic compound transport system substrate-binding protein